MKIAVLGMGRMGRAMAARLVDTDHDVTIWNRTPGRARELIARGANEATDLGAAIGDAELALTMLTADDAVREVLLPGDRPREGTAAILDCSTVSPATTAELAQAYGERFGACPVLGGPAAVQAGEATLLLAGPPALRQRVRPALVMLSSSIREVGDDAPAATMVKLLANYMLLGGLAVLSEAVAAGQAAGLPDDLLIALFEQSAAPSLRNRVADVVRGDHDGWFPTPMGAKDVRLLVRSAGRHGVELPVAELVAARYDAAAASGLSEKDIAAVVELLRRR